MGIIAIFSFAPKTRNQSLDDESLTQTHKNRKRSECNTGIVAPAPPSGSHAALLVHKDPGLNEVLLLQMRTQPIEQEIHLYKNIILFNIQLDKVSDVKLFRVWISIPQRLSGALLWFGFSWRSCKFGTTEVPLNSLV